MTIQGTNQDNIDFWSFSDYEIKLEEMPELENDGEIRSILDKFDSENKKKEFLKAKEIWESLELAFETKTPIEVKPQQVDILERPTSQQYFSPKPFMPMPKTGKGLECPKCGRKFGQEKALQSHSEACGLKMKSEPTEDRNAVPQRLNVDVKMAPKKEEKTVKLEATCANCGKVNDKPSSESFDDRRKAAGKARSHLKSCMAKGKEANIPCEFCDNKFRAKFLLTAHLRRYHERPFKCEKCDFKSGTNYELTKHMEHKHQGKTFPCKICGKVLAYAHVHKRHMKSVHGEDKFECSKCKHSTNTENNLQRHTENMHSGVTYDCNICSSKLHTERSLQTHMITHNENRTKYGCDLCDYEAFEKSMVKKHKSSVHDGKRYKCDLCDYSTKEKNRIPVHKRTIHNNEYFECEQCDAKFAKRSTLKYHNEANHGGQQFMCSECPTVLSHILKLKTHVKNYHGEIDPNGIPCDQCDYVGKRKSNLWRHRQLKHNFTLNKCNDCDYTTKYKRLLEEHTNLKHKGLGYECDVCGIKKSRKLDLDEHMQKKHK
jgi:KRAB domain-containing zinc finger protein